MRVRMLQWKRNIRKLRRLFFFGFIASKIFNLLLDYTTFYVICEESSPKELKKIAKKLKSHDIAYEISKSRTALRIRNKDKAKALFVLSDMF